MSLVHPWPLDPNPFLFCSLRLAVSRCQISGPASVVVPIFRIDGLAVRLHRTLRDLNILLVVLIAWKI